MLPVVFISLIVGMAQGSPEIGVNCGQLEIQGYQSCKIHMNGKVIMYTGPEKKIYDGPFFGLIKYQCDRDAGYLMSNIDCEKCNFKCSHEEPTVSSVCQTDATQFWSGVLGGTVCFILILLGGLVWKKFSGTLTASSLFNFWKHSDSGHADGSATTVDLEDKTLKEESGEVDGLQSAERVSEGTDRRRRNSTASIKILVSIANLLLLLTTVYSCDVTVHSGSDNVTMFCENSECTTEYLRFTVTKGYEICIEDYVGEQVFLQVSDIIWGSRYELKYYTSDYSSYVILSETCCDLDNQFQCSDVNKECYGRTLAKLGEKKASMENTYYHCEWSGTKKCTMSCAHFVEKERKGELYGIFTNTEKTVLITFTINGKRYSQSISLTAYDLQNYSLDLTNFKLKNIDSLPITVRPLSHLPSSLSLLLHKDTFYYVNASAYHNPNDTRGLYVRDDFFGDFQISLDKLSERSKRPEFRSTAGDGCNTVRLVDESMISRFLMQQSNFIKSTNFLKRKPDFSIVDTFDDVEKDRVKMYLGRHEKKDWELEPGTCEVEFAGSYGCTSCNESAYIVMEARNVTKGGLIPFSSNCSFDRYSIKCDYEPNQLILKDNHRTCFIKMPTINKRFFVHMTYFKFGHQIQRKEQINCTTAYYSYGEAVENLIASKTFIVAYFVTVLFLILLSSSVIVGLPLVYKRQI